MQNCLPVCPPFSKALPLAEQNCRARRTCQHKVPVECVVCSSTRDCNLHGHMIRAPLMKSGARNGPQDRQTTGSEAHAVWTSTLDERRPDMHHVAICCVVLYIYGPVPRTFRIDATNCGTVRCSATSLAMAMSTTSRRPAAVADAATPFTCMSCWAGASTCNFVCSCMRGIKNGGSGGGMLRCTGPSVCMRREVSMQRTHMHTLDCPASGSSALFLMAHAGPRNKIGSKVLCK